MQRFTISLDDELARQFDGFIAHKGYVNRSEAVRDLIRARLGGATQDSGADAARARWCVANLSYVYDHHDQTVAVRVLDLQHQHHDLVVASMRSTWTIITALKPHCRVARRSRSAHWPTS